MAIRIRVIDGVTVALCAARSLPKDGDVYIDDAMHEALTHKFFLDYDSFLCPGASDLVSDTEKELIEQEESNNPNRDTWDELYG